MSALIGQRCNRLARVETFEVHPKSLKHLLSRIHERELALPDFQRDFVWQPRETEALIESISRNFPAGSLLFMAYKPDTFQPREIQNAPSLSGTPLELILDGQQRLTSLYQAFYGTGDFRYFIDFNQLMHDEPDVEEAIFYRHRKRAGAYKEDAQQAATLVMPLGDLFGGREFEGWLDAIMDHRSADERPNLRKLLRAARREFIAPLEEYRFPVVTLAQATTLEAVCSIFETLNKTGVRLSVFELLAARYFAKGLDLRKLWAETQQRLPTLAEFHIDEYYVLQAVALRARGSVKRGDVLQLSRQDIETHWSSVPEGFSQALTMLRDSCGVVSEKWLPYAYMLVPMAGLWDEHIDVVGPAAAGKRAKLQQWFWCAALNARYDRAANSQAAKDFAELRRWFDGGMEPEAVQDFRFEADRLGSITPRQQSVYKALMALVLKRRPLDFHRGEQITTPSISARSIDDHHVFPRGYLDDENYDGPPERVDSILNRTMIDKITNIRIGKRAPSDYVAEIENELAADAVPVSLDDILATHGLRRDELVANDFDGFVDVRRRFLLQEIEAVTRKHVTDSGATQPAPLDVLA